MQNAERNAASDSNVRTNDDLLLKKQYSEQNGKRSSLNSSSTSMMDSKAELNSRSISMI